MNRKTVWNKIFSYRSGSTTVRYMFPFMIGTLVLFFSSVISSDKSYIKLVPSKEIVAQGEEFSIDVYVSAHVPVNAISINVGFSSEMVEIKNINTGNSVLTIWTHEPKVENGKVVFSGGTFKRGFLGEHLIGTINAKAKYNGNTEFFVENAELLAGDGLGTSVVIDKNNTNSKTSFYFYDQDEDPTKIAASVKININADIDGDGKVTLNDIGAFLASWNSKQTTYDFNDDGKMNFVDFSIILTKSFLDLAR